MEKRTRWLILIYQLPREPSRHRVAVWRKLRDLGALYLQDGVTTLPEDAVTREQLEWLQLRVREAGGEATLWEAKPGTLAEEAALVEAFRSSREKTYRDIIARAERLRRKAQMGGGPCRSGSASWSASSGRRGAGTTFAPRCASRLRGHSRPLAKP